MPCSRDLWLWQNHADGYTKCAFVTPSAGSVDGTATGPVNASERAQRELAVES
ncbi:MAG TPA: hypothetical protein PKU97_10030 [Kofleriaceae bacterium]|nr:hypothetical protein [Kofleriaceae bacterium]